MGTLAICEDPYKILIFGGHETRENYLKKVK